ncbi:MAG: Rossmann fold domain-containing protein [Pseudomonadota bacterium]
MAQAEYIVSDLPESALEASARFHAEHLSAARAAMGEGDLVIILPRAEYDHLDWREALARDLARACAPARVNVIAAGNEAEKRKLLAYLAGAKGVTGHYCQTHD